jgi:GNAT superfamily N-acetyltransferase
LSFLSLVPLLAGSSAHPQMATTAAHLRGGTPGNASATSEKIILRPPRLSDVPAMAQYSTRAYWLSPVNRFIAPRAPEYLDDLPRMFRQVIRRRLCGGECLYTVACRASDPDTPVGHGVFSRLGDDAGARAVKAELAASAGLLLRLWMYILGWLFWTYNKIDLFLRKPRAFDFEALREIEEWGRLDEEKYWTSHPERTNRWFVNSLVIDPDYQGKGIGKMLMAGVLQRAQKERVLVTLTSSPHGEFLYRKLGFEMLGDFCHRPHTERDGEGGGGYMIWYPEGYEGVRHTD